MKLNLKTKLYAGLGFLVLLIILLWTSGLIFISTLADTSGAIIENNNRTVTYMQNMEQALTEIHLGMSRERLGKVDSLEQEILQNLRNQQQNITEEGEAELSNKLQKRIVKYFDAIDDQKNQSVSNDAFFQSLDEEYGQLQYLLAQITYMNLEAIHQKNDRAQKTAGNIIFYMSIIGIASLLLAVGLLINYPGYIVNPIQELIARIKSIANQNYDQRLEFETGDEYEELAKAFNTMAARLQEFESSNLAKIKSEKQRIEAVINQMNEAVIGLDNEDNILFVNAKAEELIGIDRELLVGKYVPDLAVKNDLIRKMLSDSNNEDKNKDQANSPDLIKLPTDDRFVYYSKEVQPVLLNEQSSNPKKKIGSIITLKNVTHFQEINEAKTNFIAVVSHELKTPIASINMSLRLLEDERVGPLNDEQSELIRNIRQDAERMKTTTAELLNLSKIETGNIQLNTQPAKPVDLLQYAYETMVMQANQKNIEISTESDQELSPVKVDLQKTVWVLVNLLSNAIRYTPQDGKIIMRGENKISSVQFSVVDMGEGIAEEHLDKIFQKYFQVYGDSDGSGLGLSIAKEFINAQGGEIGVESEVGKGSTFYFTLPKVKE
ncbi:HAMP domain-containing sensor histidine kinase [Fodinibius sp. Rm-B-1B1-1]|uniref:HAMP domain-containing sensor histidine kinase n=1 Tax=Fodinibius alkaliphilus TaxID=3140241 RepID=UPI00315B0BF8